MDRRKIPVHPYAPVTVLNPDGRFPVVLTCEHASCAVPTEYQNLGLNPDYLKRHIGWDIGARAVVQEIIQHIDSPAVFSGYSRLLIDCNRDLSDHDLVIPKSDGIPVPANRHVTDSERQRRIADFYNPYHAAIDHVLAQKKSQPTILLSVHSFTPILGKKKRLFDLGVLFDRYADLAQKFGQLLSQTGYRVRYNEPYSGYDGLIFSACRHGEHNHLVYLEIEMNQGLLLNPAGIAEMGQKLSQVLKDLFTSQKEHTA